MNWFGATVVGVPFLIALYRLTVGRFKRPPMTEADYFPEHQGDPRHRVGGRPMLGTYVDMDDLPNYEEPF